MNSGPGVNTGAAQALCTNEFSGEVFEEPLRPRFARDPRLIGVYPRAEGMFRKDAVLAESDDSFPYDLHRVVLSIDSQLIAIFEEMQPIVAPPVRRPRLEIVGFRRALLRLLVTHRAGRRVYVYDSVARTPFRRRSLRMDFFIPELVAFRATELGRIGDDISLVLERPISAFGSRF